MPIPDPPEPEPRPRGADRVPDAFPGEFPRTGEVPAVIWPQVWRDRLRGGTRIGRRIGRRVHEGPHTRWWVLATALTGLFSIGVTITVVAVSIGTIADDLGSSEVVLSWVVTGPLLALALGMPLYGRLGDVHGHRRFYLAGFATFTVLTALTALAWDAPSLIVLRVLAALAGAATGPASMALIMRAFPDEERVKAMGWWSLVGAGAPVLGLVVGGPVVDAFGWRWIFVGQAPLSLAAVVLAAVVLRETPRRAHETLDLRGAATLCLATVSLLLALSQAGSWGLTHPATLGLALVAPVAAAGFVRAERRAAYPLVPLALLTRENVRPSLVAQFCSNFAYMGGFFITPLFVQQEFGWTVAITGYVMLCRPLTFSISSPIAGYVATRVGERAASVAGTTMVVASMASFAGAVASRSVPLVVVGLLLSGLGLGTSQPSLMSSVANAVEPDHLGVVNALQAMTAQVGVSAGIQVLVAVQALGDGTSPFAAAYLVGGLVAAAGAVAAGRVRSLERAVAAGPT